VFIAYIHLVIVLWTVEKSSNPVTGDESESAAGIAEDTAGC